VDLSVVILNWNTRALLEKCLGSLTCPPRSIDCEIVVVDNASEDRSRQMVEERFPSVRVISNRSNVGFGAGNNVAIPETSGRYILFLNSDTVVTEGALEAMVRYADAHPTIGILGPKLLNADGSLQYSCRRYPNLGTGLFRNTPLGRLFPHNRYNTDYLYSDWDHSEPRDVEWLSGAALMARRALLDRIGGFDDDFFMFCEDVDLCWRANFEPLPPGASDPDHSEDEDEQAAKRTNWRVTYFPGAVIYHLIGRSTDKVPTRMTYEFHRSQYIFYAKHFRAGTPILVRPLIPAGIALRALGQLARHRSQYWIRRLRGQIKPWRFRTRAR
jgi:GT2 family glycosyltransferase